MPKTLSTLCQEKTARGNRYWSIDDAQNAASQLSRRAGVKILGFRCLVCGWCHVGKPGRRSLSEEVPVAGDNFDFNIFDSYQDEFVPQRAFRSRIEDIPNGDYELAFKEAAFEFLKRKPVLKVYLQITGGTEFEHVWWLERQEGLNTLGADMVALGFDVDRQVKAGKNLGDVFKAIAPQLVGLKFKARKTSREDNRPDKKGVFYHELKITCRVAGGSAMPTGPAAFNEFQQPAAAGAGSNLPF